MALVKIDTIVRDICMNLDGDLNRYANYLSYALRGVKKMATLSNGVQVRKVLKVEAGNVATLPDDYLDYIMVGTVGQDGNIHAFGKNDRMAFLDIKDDCGNKVNPSAQGDPRTLETAGIGYNPAFPDGYPFNVNAPIYGNVYFGTGGGYNQYGYMNVNVASNCIELSSDHLYTEIVLVYITNGVKLGAQTEINEMAYEALRAFIKWQFMLDRRNSPISQLDHAERIWNQEHRIFRNARLSFTVDEFKAALRSGYSQAPKN